MSSKVYANWLNYLNYRLNGLERMLIVLALLISFNSLWSQSVVSNEEGLIKDRINLLFDAMRSNDSTLIMDLFTAEATLSSIYKDRKTGKVVKRSNPASGFITAIGTPHDQVWNERLWSYDIKVDGIMASAWTEYTFYVDQQLSHCGVNVFELMKTELGWQISGVTDTRRTSGCKESEEHKINDLMDAWHESAAVADEEVFFGSMTDDGIYIGTDATERWSRDEMFELLGKYFQRESAWDFTATERNVTISDHEDIAWFDELLDTWMGTCRSSGVVQKIDGQWKIAHYHLSIAVPNDKVDDYLKSIGKERKD